MSFLKTKSLIFNEINRETIDTKKLIETQNWKILFKNNAVRTIRERQRFELESLCSCNNNAFFHFFQSGTDDTKNWFDEQQLEQRFLAVKILLVGAN